VKTSFKSINDGERRHAVVSHSIQFAFVLVYLVIWKTSTACCRFWALKRFCTIIFQPRGILIPFHPCLIMENFVSKQLCVSFLLPLLTLLRLFCHRIEMNLSFHTHTPAHTHTHAHTHTNMSNDIDATINDVTPFAYIYTCISSGKLRWWTYVVWFYTSHYYM